MLMPAKPGVAQLVENHAGTSCLSRRATAKWLIAEIRRQTGVIFLGGMTGSSPLRKN